MFRRRKALPIPDRMKELVWPRTGWRRTMLYVAHRLSRLPGTPYQIAAGFACGVAISFTPFHGFHFVLAALLALVIRASVVASAVGTAVGNPWTFPLIIWPWIYMFGRWLLGEPDNYQLPDDLSMHYIFENPSSVFLPMVVGGVPTAVVAWFACFWPIRAMVRQYQRARLRRLREKVLKRQERAAAPAYAGRGTESDR